MVGRLKPMGIMCEAIVLATGLLAAACTASRNRGDELEARIAELEASQATAKQRLVAHEEELLRLRASVDEPAEAPLLGWTGVIECDEYILKYSRCIEDKLPDAVKETSLRALETSIDAWKKAASIPAGREGLALACKTADEAVAEMCGWESRTADRTRRRSRQ